MNVRKWFATPAALLKLRAEVKRLRNENSELQAKNDSMRAGMRRCVTCEYRLDVKQRQGTAPVLDTTKTEPRE